MEHQINLIPLQGMEWDGVPLSFGQSRAEVSALLGDAEEVRGKRACYRGGELALDFDADDRLEFIEFLGGVEGKLRPELYGQDVFAADADELCADLAERNGPDIDEDEAPYCYALRGLSVGLYREVAPQDIDAMLREMCKMDLTQLGGIDIEDERQKAGHWAAVGIGQADYYI